MNTLIDDTKEIPGFEGLYAITRDGVVYSLPRKYSPKLLVMKEVGTYHGYVRVVLSGPDRTKLYYVHRLVAETYIPNTQNKPMINHKNGIKTDNRVDNLEWVTCLENHTHAFENGKYPRQIIHPSEKHKVVEMVRQGVPIDVAGERFGLKPMGVESLLRRYKEVELRMAA
ncbi:HNH endonuclease [Geomonas subterranea]|uniref:HNH endonuclease n=1 Tax=Geomonas subterranea TaxID=2847989 RepID=UPI001CD43E27|nr:HNH endonuclease [Geomonas fuzhouensis]